ncbi:hypothetical protein Hanom_Chr11g01061751 [Helianthus anomalus]
MGPNKHDCLGWVKGQNGQLLENMSNGFGSNGSGQSKFTCYTSTVLPSIYQNDP